MPAAGRLASSINSPTFTRNVSTCDSKYWRAWTLTFRWPLADGGGHDILQIRCHFEIALFVEVHGLHELAEIPRDQVDAGLDGLGGDLGDHRLESADSGVDVVAQSLHIRQDVVLEGFAIAFQLGCIARHDEVQRLLLLQSLALDDGLLFLRGKAAVHRLDGELQLEHVLAVRLELSRAIICCDCVRVGGHSLVNRRDWIRPDLLVHASSAAARRSTSRRCSRTLA